MKKTNSTVNQQGLNTLRWVRLVWDWNRQAKYWLLDGTMADLLSTLDNEEEVNEVIENACNDLERIVRKILILGENTNAKQKLDAAKRWIKLEERRLGANSSLVRSLNRLTDKALQEELMAALKRARNEIASSFRKVTNIDQLTWDNAIKDIP